MVPGFKMLLMGPTGSGKTTSLRTLLEAGLEVFAIFTEPRFDVIPKAELDRMHWRYVAPATADWRTLRQTAHLVNTASNENIQKMQSIAGSQFTQFMDIIALCNDFVDQNGQSFGDVSGWGTNRVLVIDSLTGLSKMARKIRAGSKPILTQPDWGVSMALLQEVVDTLVNGLFCHFVLTAHVEREVDEVTGASRVMVSTLGRKLAPVLPVNFSEVVMAKRVQGQFFWSTDEYDADLKGNYLPTASRIQPSFTPLLAEWSRRGGAVASEAPAAWQPTR